MNPVQARPVDELQKVNRNVLCKHYDGCLDVALSQGWKSFSCGSCACFSLIQKSPLEWEEDMLRCGALLGVVFGRRIMPETGF
jgi:hypothetical protein